MTRIGLLHIMRKAPTTRGHAGGVTGTVYLRPPTQLQVKLEYSPTTRYWWGIGATQRVSHAFLVPCTWALTFRRHREDRPISSSRRYRGSRAK